jgi:hypothetical protein
VVTVVELGVALLVFAICAFWIVRHFHGLAQATRDGGVTVQPLAPEHLAETYRVRPAVTPVPKSATLQSAGVRSNPEAAKTKVAEAMVKLDLPAPRPLAAPTTTPTPSPAMESSLPIGPVPLPLSAANYAGRRVAAKAAPAALPVVSAVAAPAIAVLRTALPDQSSEISPRGQRAAVLPPSTAVAIPVVAPSSVGPSVAATIMPAPQQPLASAPSQPQAPLPEIGAIPAGFSASGVGVGVGAPYHISTSQHRGRVVGADTDDKAWNDFFELPALRPRSPSIWSKTLRRAGGGNELEMMTILFGHQSVKAERLPIRAEPRRIGPSDHGGRRIRVLGLVSETETPAPGLDTGNLVPPAQSAIPIAAPAAAPELSPSTVEEKTSQLAAVPTVPVAKSATVPTRSRIKRATKLVGKPRLEPDLKSKAVVATKVLGAEPAPLKSRLPQTRKDRPARAVAAPVRKLYLAGQDVLTEPGAASA